MISIKRMVIYLIILIISINYITIAAVVSDNDGSAFITKSEFDSLKNDFQSQLDNYNTGLDSKIDVAIASYLAGIKSESENELTNLYDLLGGSNIKFGKIANLTSPTKPITGYGIYFINCWKSGYLAFYGGAGYIPIREPSNSAWWTSGTGYQKGNGQRGTFITYDLNDDKKYLSSYKRCILEAVYVGGWYRAGEHVNSSQEYILGSAPTILGESCTVGTTTLVDSWNSYYRVYTDTNSDGTKNDFDLTTWTSGWNMDTTANKYFIDNEEYNKPSDYRTIANVLVNSAGGPTDQYTKAGTVNGSIQLTNIRIYGWKYDFLGDSTGKLQTYSNLIPGFYNGKKYTNSLYGGVQFFTTGKKDGKIKINDLKFTRHIKSGTSIITNGDVYFAINSSSFANSTNLAGDVKLTKIPDIVTLDVESQNLYKVAANHNISIEFDAKANTTYYIKCQYQKAVTTSNYSYCGISDGAKILITVEQ